MSVKMALLAVLSEEDLPAYQIWKRFRDRTGGAWPLNIGQVSTTLARLEDQGLVNEVRIEARDATGREIPVYGLTDRGENELEEWWRASADRTIVPRDDLGMKAALVLTASRIDATEWVTQQKRDLMVQMRDLTRLRSSSSSDPVFTLTLEHSLEIAEADYRWLDQVAEVARATGTRAPRSASQTRVRQ